MRVEATTAAPPATDADTIVIGVFDGERVAHDLPGGELSALLESGEARTRFAHLALTRADGRRFLLIGLGARDDFDAEQARAAAATACARACELSTGTLCWEVPHHVDEAIVQALVAGTLLRAYRFDRYKPRDDDDGRPERLILSAHHDIAGPVARAATISEARNRARDLANTPANELTPAALADYAAASTDVSVTVLEEREIREAGMGAFAAVAQGSAQDARLIRLEYRGAGGGPLLGLVGKAVTFDSGGLWIKPPLTMHEMKFDMAGGAAVIEAISALAELKAPVDVIGYVGATENMPSGDAVKPGDIVRALDGTTIEVNNSDAEGRLVLADLIALARREGCERLLDLATLTGGVVAALGSVYAGLMSNDEPWAQAVQDAAQRAGEPVWRLPLHPLYAKMVKGRYAQLTNLPMPRVALAITAAEFLHHFAGEVPWAHVDMAGTAYDVRRPYYADKGATGFGVRLAIEAALGATSL